MSYLYTVEKSDVIGSVEIRLLYSYTPILLYSYTPILLYSYTPIPEPNLIQKSRLSSHVNCTRNT